MNDPQVVSIRYGVQGTEHVVYDNPPPLEWSGDLFDLRLADQALVATMKCHCPTDDAARALVEPLLEAWMIDSGLAHNRPALRFDYQGARIVDQSPAPADAGKAAVNKFCSTLVLTDRATCRVASRVYPPPPTGFSASGEVKALWLRYRGYLEGREPLASMAYFCLTLLEGSTGVKKGARHRVCEKYRIADEVRDKLGDLVSQKGGMADARKLDHEATGVPLTGQEQSWIEQVTVALIRRKAEYDANPHATFEEITLKTLEAQKSG